MKFLAIASVAVAAGNATAAEPSAPQLVSIQSVNEDGVTVELPTVKNADGTVCTSYVADVTRSEDSGQSRIDSTVRQFCDTREEHLVAMRSFKSNGLTIQAPTIRVTQGLELQINPAKRPF